MKVSIRHMMIAVAVLAMTLALMATHHQSLGCGHCRLPLTFRAVDDRTGSPVIGAKINLHTYNGWPPDLSMVTGDGGLAAGIVEVGHTSYEGPYFRRYRVYSYSQYVRVEAEGYRREEGMLRDYLDNPLHFTSKSLHTPVTLRLKRR